MINEDGKRLLEYLDRLANELKVLRDAIRLDCEQFTNSSEFLNSRENEVNKLIEKTEDEKRIDDINKQILDTRSAIKKTQHMCTTVKPKGVKKFEKPIITESLEAEGIDLDKWKEMRKRTREVLRCTKGMEKGEDCPVICFETRNRIVLL